MAGLYTQDTRIGAFNTPLGKDKLVLRRFSGSEGMNELFEYQIDVVTRQDDLNFDDAICKNCTLAMKTIAGGTRYFDGLLAEVVKTGENDEGFIYRLTLRPWLWVLSKRTNCLIFHEKTAPDIISEIFGKHGGIAKFEQSLSKSYPTLEYCVQYRESDMAFVCRLMEQHGISFHFRHEQGKHTLVMSDSASAYEPIEGEKRPYVAVEKQHKREREHFFHWGPERKFTTGRVKLNDYDFKRPTADMKSETAGDAKYANGELEFYDYPGKYVVKQDGQNYAQSRIDMERAADGHFFAAGDCVSCTPGDLMTLTDHPQASQNRRYLALRCTHSFTTEAYRSTSESDDSGYDGRYEFMLADRPLAPPIVTKKPFLRGPQTALVVGDGEIDCDEYGRILVRFFWDLNNDQSMRARVAQVWASQQWGGIFIPRVGMEVLVDFLEGDPDHPIVVGCVYNGQNMPPYDLPGEKNIAGWKSNSTPGSGGYNEIVMDDTAGKELLRVHAQYDLDSTVEHDESRRVKNNRTTKVDIDDTLKVGNELMIEAGSKITLKVGASTIVIDGVSITVSSNTVDVKATQLFQSKSQMLSSHSADVQMEIKGTIVKIN